jgi:hypothetical protein
MLQGGRPAAASLTTQPADWGVSKRAHVLPQLPGRPGRLPLDDGHAEEHLQDTGPAPSYWNSQTPPESHESHTHRIGKDTVVLWHQQPSSARRLAYSRTRPCQRICWLAAESAAGGAVVNMLHSGGGATPSNCRRSNRGDRRSGSEPERRRACTATPQPAVPASGEPRSSETAATAAAPVRQENTVNATSGARARLSCMPKCREFVVLQSLNHQAIAAAEQPAACVCNSHGGSE